MTVIKFVELLMQLSMFSMIGLYLIFSNTIMYALKNLSNGAEAMIEINRIILNPLFYLVFFSSAAAAIYWTITKTGEGSYAGGVFFVGTFMVTAFKNVPMNNQLRESEQTSVHADVWQQYLKKWTFWNHIRTLSALVAGFLLLI